VDEFVAYVVGKVPLLLLLVLGDEFVYQGTEVAHNRVADLGGPFDSIQAPVDGVGGGGAGVRPITEAQRRRYLIRDLLLLLSRTRIEVGWGGWLVVARVVGVN